jgi:hypothetical protein
MREKNPNDQIPNPKQARKRKRGTGTLSCSTKFNNVRQFAVYIFDRVFRFPLSRAITSSFRAKIDRLSFERRVEKKGPRPLFFLHLRSLTFAAAFLTRRHGGTEKKSGEQAGSRSGFLRYSPCLRVSVFNCSVVSTNCADTNGSAAGFPGNQREPINLFHLTLLSHPIYFTP